MSNIFYPNSCEADVVAHVCDPCDTPEAGRISSLAAIHASYISTVNADPDNATVWQDGIEQGLIMIIPEVSGSISSTGKYTDGVGRSKERYTGRDFKISATDPNWIGNTDTYNGLQKSSKYHVAYATENKFQISKYPATWKPDEPVEIGLDSERVWKLEIEFQQKDFSTPYDIPEDIFVCFTVEP